MKGAKEKPPVDRGEADERDKWWEEKPGTRAYHFGETYDPKNKTKDYWLCPICGWGKKGDPHIDINGERREVQLICPKGHQWALNTKTNTIVEINQSLKFPEK